MILRVRCVKNSATRKLLLSITYGYNTASGEHCLTKETPGIYENHLREYGNTRSNLANKTLPPN